MSELPDQLVEAVLEGLGLEGAPSLDEAGLAVFPANEPYCEEHGLIIPPRARRCSIDDQPLEVSCPVDGTVRSAELDICSGCGTAFKLGAKAGTAVVLASDGPPEGGDAIA